MMETLTRTDTFNVVDIRRVFASFATDFRLVADWTDLRSESSVNETLASVRALAEAQYISEVHIILRSRNGSVRRSARYRVSTSAGSWSADRPGNMYWSHNDGDCLNVVVSYSKKWTNLSAAAQQAFRDRYLRGWTRSDVDLNYPGLAGASDRRYASRDYGLERTQFS